MEARTALLAACELALHEAGRQAVLLEHRVLQSVRLYSDASSRYSSPLTRRSASTSSHERVEGASSCTGAGGGKNHDGSALRRGAAAAGESALAAGKAAGSGEEETNDSEYVVASLIAVAAPASRLKTVSSVAELDAVAVFLRPVADTPHAACCAGPARDSGGVMLHAVAVVVEAWQSESGS